MATKTFTKVDDRDADPDGGGEEAQEVQGEEDTREFKVQLNGAEDLQLRLTEFKKACDAHERHLRKRCKRRYYNLGLMARIVMDTTDDELKSLLKNGARTFLIDTVANKPNEFEQILIRTKNAIDEYQNADPSARIVTGLALEMHGDCCRVGRMRNNCSVLLQRGETITLTVDESYRYSCFKEIAYVLNLKYYLKTLSLNDVLRIGKEARGKVIKRLKDNVAVLIEDAGLLNSYEYIELPNQCYSLQPESFPDLFTPDLEMAQKAKADYIVMPKIRCKPFLRTLRSHLKDEYKFKLIGTVDLDFISCKMLDLMGIIKMLDYLWIPDMFTVSSCIQRYIFADVIPIAKCLKKSIIGSVPLERCSDFKSFENHDFLWKIDAIFIEKSSWCNKYPLIVKKLLPIRDYRLAVVNDCMTIKNVLTSYQSIVNFIIRTISTIECQAIVMHSKCETAATALGRVEIYCPVLLMLPMDPDLEEDWNCKINLARALNLRRNLRGILYTKDMNECNLKPIEYGIEYARKNELLHTGDFIITLEVCKEDEGNVEYGVGEDVVILRAFYLAPPKTAENFKYA